MDSSGPKSSDQASEAIFRPVFDQILPVANRLRLEHSISSDQRSPAPRRLLGNFQTVYSPGETAHDPPSQQYTTLQRQATNGIAANV